MELKFEFDSLYDSNSLTKEFVELYVTDEAIYNRYLQVTDFKKPIRSPFATDNTPSFSFFCRDGKLLWKDFSSGKGGDKYTLINHLNGGNLSFKEVLRIIAIDFGLIKFVGKVNTSLIKKSPSIALNTPLAEINVIPKELELQELTYWMKFNIDKKILNQFNVKSVSECWINDKIFYKYNPKIKELCFRYTLNGGFKIYRPQAEKKNKWRNNIEASCVWGLEQLTYRNDTVFIVSSLKDTMCMTSLGFEAVNLNSESCVIPLKLIEYLKTRYDYVIIFLDADSAGLQASRKEHKRLNIPYLFLPLTLKIKDQSDCVRELGSMVTREIIIDLLDTFIYI